MPKEKGIGGLALLLGGEEEDSSSAAEAVLKAIKANDAEALDSALKDHYEECKMSSSEEDEDEEEDESDY